MNILNPHLKTRRLLWTPLFFLAFISLAACGVKPDRLDAPAGANEDAFPRSYPAPR